MKRTLDSINVLQASKVMAVAWGLLGVVFGVVAFVVLLLNGQHIEALAMLVFPPIATAIEGFVGTAIFAAVYNIVAKRMGGIEFEVS